MVMEVEISSQATAARSRRCRCRFSVRDPVQALDRDPDTDYDPQSVDHDLRYTAEDHVDSACCRYEMLSGSRIVYHTDPT